MMVNNGDIIILQNKRGKEMPKIDRLRNGVIESKKINVNPKKKSDKMRKDNQKKN